MCGIIGWFGTSLNPESIESLRKGNIAAAHRGPDGSGLIAIDLASGRNFDLERSETGGGDGNWAALGHRRLSIIDISEGGHQPMSRDNDRLWITFNGEIYNYRELRKELQILGHEFRSESDTEVILAAYQEWGTACVGRFEGMWAFVIVDLKRQTAFGSRDRWGIKPFHYTFRDGELLFSSEIRQLLAFQGVGRKYNRMVAAGFVLYGSIESGEDTFFDGIKSLPQGHNFEYCLRSREFKKYSYYQPDFAINQNISIDDAAMEFRRLFIESIELHLRADVPIGSCLSGGIDSSSIVMVIKDLLGKSGKSELQRTFSSHFEEQEANEMIYMEEAFRASGAKYEIVRPVEEGFISEMDTLIRAQEEPFGSTSIYAQWCVYRLAKESGVKVLLDGQGADEMLAGYVGLANYYDLELLHKKEHLKLFYEKSCRLRLNGTKNPRLTVLRQGADVVMRRMGLSKFWSSGGGASANIPSASTSWALSDVAKEVIENHPHFANQRRFPYEESEKLNNVLYQLTYHNNLQGLLKYADRNSMASSVESRVPFVHRPLMEFVFSLAANHKIRDGYTKRVLRDSMEGILPKKIQNRVSKLGFATPEQSWFKGPLGEQIRESLNDAEIRNFLKPDEAASYFSDINQYGIRDSAPWRWLNFVRWRQLFSLE